MNISCVRYVKKNFKKSELRSSEHKMRFPFLTSNHDLLIIDSDLKTELIPGPFLGCDTCISNSTHRNFEIIVYYTANEDALIMTETKIAFSLNAKLETQFLIRKAIITDDNSRLFRGLILTYENELYFFSLNPLDDKNKTTRLLEHNIFDVVNVSDNTIKLVVLTTEGSVFRLEQFAEEHQLVNLLTSSSKVQQITSTDNSLALLNFKGEIYVYGYVLHGMYDFISDYYNEGEITQAIQNYKPLVIPNLPPSCQAALMRSNLLSLSDGDHRHQIWGINTTPGKARIEFPKLTSSVSRIHTTEHVCFLMNQEDEY